MVTWIDGVFHDGSEIYVSNLYPQYDDKVELRLRVPLNAPIHTVNIRTSMDGEQSDIYMDVSHDDATHRWYQAKLHIRNKVMAYRFRLIGDEAVWFYTGLGMSMSESPDAYSFRLVTNYQAPTWLSNAVFYQIFPERFFNGDPTLNPEAGVQVSDHRGRSFTTRLLDWDTDVPLPWHEGGNVDFFGGDLPGIEAQIPYLQELGVNAVYLNPIFTSESNHKYNVEDFYEVDRHFGGNEALISLSKALHDAGIRLILDITTNHCGSNHKWFKAAQEDPNAHVATYFTFYKHPHDYESWLGHISLPKLNYHADTLRDEMYRDENSVFRFWMKAPYNVDGWRLDVWNMTAKQGDFDDNHGVGRELHQAVKETNPESYVFGETFFDGTSNLQGDQLDGVMNYRGFTFPVWRWLGGHRVGSALPDDHSPRIPAEAMVTQMQEYMAAIPWIIARQQYNLLGSHDTPRILTTVHESIALAKVAAALLLTFPGVPSVYYGEEIGMKGSDSTGQNRFPMPWNQDKWNVSLREYYQQLIQLRRESDALQNGGYQVLYAEGDVFVFQRQSKQERLIIIAYRGAKASTESSRSIEIPLTHGCIADGAKLHDVFTKAQYHVADGKITVNLPTEGVALILMQ